MQNKNKITIIGGGVNGVCSAYYLHKAGYKVEIIDPTFSDQGTSYGNAGMIVPSHFIPMASPGIISKGMKWMFDSSSPFYIKPRLNLRLAQWLWRFTRSCNIENVEKYQELIWKYNELSKNEYQAISEQEDLDFDFQKRGLLMLYKSEKSKNEEVKVAQKALELGLNVEILDLEAVQKLNPDTKVDVLGGIYYPDDAHIYSNHFMLGVIDLLRSGGVEFIAHEVVDARSENDKIVSLKLDNDSIHLVDQVVVTGGAWSWKIAKLFVIKILLEDGIGYSITQKNIDIKPTIPAILTDEKVAITPMGADLRITGSLEISGLSPKVNQKRVNGFLAAVPKYFPEVKIESEARRKIWTGYRPLSFDGVPYVGSSTKVENVVIATGHGMMGMSLGPATGKIVSEIVQGKDPEIDISLMKIDR